MRKAALLALGAMLYALAAWAVAPGFYDGVAPQAPYRWVSPPPVARTNNQPPLSGSVTVKTGSNGVVDPGTAFTGDGQASLSFVPGSFAASASGVTVTVKPVTDFPSAAGIQFQTNVYLIQSTSPLTKEALVTLRYSDLVPAPSDIYFAPESGGSWKKIGSTGQSAPYNISARTTQVGYFAAGFPAGAQKGGSGARIGGGQTLPIITAIAILLVVLAGVPLALLRRRGASDEPPEDEE